MGQSEKSVHSPQVLWDYGSISISRRFRLVPVYVSYIHSNCEAFIAYNVMYDTTYDDCSFSIHLLVLAYFAANVSLIASDISP